MSLVLILAMVFASIVFLLYNLVPFATVKATDLNKKRAERFASKMERILMRTDIQKMSRFLLFAPVGGAIIGYLFFPQELRFLGVVGGAVTGFIFPNIYIKFLI